MSYHDVLNYLIQKTQVVELCNQLGVRIAVCPEWNGRVLTSTCDGLEGDSFGGVNVQAIDAERFEDFGGEDHWTISPLVHSFTVETIRENKAVLQRTIQMADANGTTAEFQLSRAISLLSRQNIGTLFGDVITDSLERDDVSVVGFCTENTVRSQENVCVASRLRGMFNANPNAVIILSIPPDSFASASSLVDIDYLGGSPHGRIRHLPQTLLVRADGQRHCRITMPFSFSSSIIGAVEFRLGTLTLWTCDLPGDSEEDMVRIYNHGRSHVSESDLAAYYEMNCFSAPQELQPDNSLTYCQSILHLNADNTILDDLVQQIFEVSLAEISQKMFR